jgi:hypothetical protein
MGVTWVSVTPTFVQAAAVLCGQGLVSSKNQHFGCTLVGHGTGY